MRLVFLGGVGEIGMNCLALETGQGIVVVDCGVMFADSSHGGPDLIVPDLRYFRVNRKRIAGVVITHGHEDHIGAVPVVFGAMDVPVYAPRFAAALIREKTLEYTKSPAFELKTVAPGQKLELAGLEIEFVRVTHSIPDALALAIRTPVGLIVHTGDFRIDSSPTLGEPFDTPTFTRLGDEGVLLMLSDSTNAERGGHTKGEQWVVDNLTELIRKHDGRVLVSLFSSNIERVRLLAGMARKLGRRIGLVGRSLYTYSRIALETGYWPFDPNEIVDPYFADELPGHDLLLLVAGSQGEPRASLTRVSSGDHPDVKIRKGDMVIYSSRIIPGNEKGILRVTNSLVKKGARVFDEHNAPVHTSGHAMRDELDTMLKLLRPRYFIPIHGEYRYLVQHAQLAQAAVGASTLVVDSGWVAGVRKNGVEPLFELDLEPCFVEGPLVGSEEELKLKERKKLLYNGLVVVRCCSLTKKGKKSGEGLSAEVTLYGVPDPDGALADQIASMVEMEFVNRDSSLSPKTIEQEIRTLVRRVVKKRLEKKPLVHVVL